MHFQTRQPDEWIPDWIPAAYDLRIPPDQYEELTRRYSKVDMMGQGMNAGSFSRLHWQVKNGRHQSSTKVTRKSLFLQDSLAKDSKHTIPLAAPIAYIMKLLEIIHPPRVADEVLATGFALAKKLGKIAVSAGVCDGFIGNRIMSAYRRECEYMLEP